MDLEEELRQVKLALRTLVDVVDTMSRKSVELRRLETRVNKQPLPIKPEVRVVKDDQRVWVRAKDICRSARNPNSLLPISHSTWYKGVASGRFPAPRKLGRSSIWKLTDIIQLVDTDLT